MIINYMPQKPEDILKAAREKRKFTQEDIAQKLGISTRQYIKYESGLFPKFKKEIIQKIDKIFGTSITALIYEQTIHAEEVDLEEEIGEIKERLLRTEAHLEVFKSAIAGLMTKEVGEFAEKFELLQGLVEKAVNRQFDELQRK